MNNRALIGVLAALALLGGLFVYTGGDINETFEQANEIVEEAETTLETVEPVVREFEDQLTDEDTTDDPAEEPVIDPNDTTTPTDPNGTDG